MTISVNNKSIEVATPQSIITLLEHLHFDNGKGIAVAVNNQVIAKSYWQSHFIQENDRLMIIRATQGG